VIRKGQLVVRALPLAVMIAVAFIANASANHSVQALISTGPAGGNGANDAFFTANTPNGDRAYFETDEKLVAADTDNQFDVYERYGTVTTLISTSSTAGNGAFDASFDAVSADGSRVFFETDEKLVPADTDNQFDIYQRSGGVTTLISTGPDGGNGDLSAFFDGISQDGTHVFFETDESLLSADTDTVGDVYERSAGTTTQVSTGPNGGNGASYAFFLAASQDGSRVFFDTDESLTSDDTDSQVDIYQRSGGTTTRVSTSSLGGNGAFGAVFDGISVDGSHVFFDTAEALTGDDIDSSIDIYERFSGATTRVSRGLINGNGAFNASFGGNSDDGGHVFFVTREALLSGDTDSSIDVYDRSGGTTSQVSTGSTGGNGAFNAFFDGSSQFGDVVFFDTQEALEAGDSDTRSDIYKRSGGVTTLISTGPNGGNGAFQAAFAGNSQGGSRVFFETDESLTTNDTDSTTDVYERFAGATTRISIGPLNGNGAFAAIFDGSSLDGTRAFFDTREQLTSQDTDTALDVYAAMVDSPYPRPGTGSPLRVPLVSAYAACLSPNTTHVGPAPLNRPSCNPPHQESTLLTTSPLGKGGAFARLDVIPGDPGTTADEADINIVAIATDVRKSDGTDYTGKVILTTTLRITDFSNGFSGSETGTVQDTQFSVPINCSGTPADSGIGSNCAVTTTADALVPNFPMEGKRSVVSAFTTKLLDAGADGSITPPSGSCPPTCGSGDEKTYLVQGIFAP
jgi:hypothetical protein